MEVLGIILIVYGIICVLIAALRPPFIMNIKKMQIFEKYLGKLGTTLFVLGFGIAAIVIGFLIYK
ncbi:MAG: hypothetical protein RQ856_03625 [Candidatus Izemoplasmatales bacterium]|nr:hypothetical protein [Candidatus Izemoplasmatales bacterium]